MALQALFHLPVGWKQVPQQQDVTFAAGVSAQEIANDTGPFRFNMKSFGSKIKRGNEAGGQRGVCHCRSLCFALLDYL